MALVMATWTSYRRERASLEQGMLHTARALSGAIDREILGAQYALQGLAVTDDLDRGDFAAFRRHAQRLLEAAGIGERIELVDADARVLVDTSGPAGAAPSHADDPERVRQVFSSGQPYVTDLIEGTPARVLISVDVPVVRAHRAVYDLGLVFPADRLQRLVNAQMVPADWNSGVTDRYGIVLARMQNPAQLVGRKAETGVLQAIGARPEGIGEETSFEGIRYLGAFRRSEVSGFVTVVAAPSRTLYAQLWQTTALTTLGLAGLLLAATALAWRIADPLKRAIRQLNAAATTERERAALLLNEREQKLQGLFELSPLGIALNDMSGRFVDFNDAFRRICGYPEQELRQLDYWSLTPKEYQAQEALQLESLRRTGKYGPYEKEYVRKDGSRVPLVLNGVLVKGSEGADYIWSIVEDITERRRAQQELDRHRHHLQEIVDERTAQLDEARRSAEEANRAKSQFLANMSHEIRTPLNVLAGMAYLIRGDGVTARQEQWLQRMEQASAHLLEIINDILDLARIEAGKLSLQSGPVDVPALVAGVGAMLTARLQGRPVQVQVHTEGLDEPLRGDATRLQQALLNYGDNAVKFTEQGHIRLTARTTEQTDHGALLRFEVQDTGAGIAPDALARLFEMFQQADGSPTRRHGGTGLGLAITRRLAQLMGGDAGASSTPGVGSTFWFTARLARGEESSGEAAADRGREQPPDQRLQQHAGRRVLLAEDDAVNREVALHLLQRVGLTVDTARSGREAVELGSRNAYDLILMDVQMPELDGLEATRSIRSLPAGGTVPIVALTANAFQEDEARCLAAGMSDFLAKPVRPEALYSMLLRWLPGDPAA